MKNCEIVEAFYISPFALSSDGLKKLPITNDHLNHAVLGFWVQAKDIDNFLPVIFPVLCCQGFHGSIDFYDAVTYRYPYIGCTLCIASYSGPITEGTDKIAATFRRIDFARTIESQEDIRYIVDCIQSINRTPVGGLREELDAQNQKIRDWIMGKTLSVPQQIVDIKQKKVPKRDSLGRFSK